MRRRGLDQREPKARQRLIGVPLYGPPRGTRTALCSAGATRTIKARQSCRGTGIGSVVKSEIRHDTGSWISNQLGSLTAKKTAKAADKGT
jgi:hypothetical protein